MLPGALALCQRERARSALTENRAYDSAISANSAPQVPMQRNQAESTRQGYLAVVGDLGASRDDGAVPTGWPPGARSAGDQR